MRMDRSCLPAASDTHCSRTLQPLRRLRMDWLYRSGYRAGLRAAAAVVVPAAPGAQGAAVAVWHGGRLLLVRMSYRAELDLPGRRHRIRRDAARGRSTRATRGNRPLTSAAELEPAGAFRFEDYHRPITTHLFLWRPAERPSPSGGRAGDPGGELPGPAEFAAARLAKLPRLYLASPARLPSGTCQTSRAYSWIVRSRENQPMRAVLSARLRPPAGRIEYVASTSAGQRRRRRSRR